MSAEASASIYLGIWISRKNLKKHLVLNDGKKHTESRYNEKTGAKLADVEVVDLEPYTTLVLNDGEYDHCIDDWDCNEAMDELCKLIGAKDFESQTYEGDDEYQDGDFYGCTIGVRLGSTDCYEGYGAMSETTKIGTDWPEMLEKWRQALADLGIRVPKSACGISVGVRCHD